MKYICTYDNITQASSSISKGHTRNNASNVSQTCNYNRSQAYNCIWKYEDEYNLLWKDLKSTNARLLHYFKTSKSKLKSVRTEERAKELFKIWRWADKIICPFCSSKKIFNAAHKKYKYKCLHCKQSFDLKTGTYFHRSDLSYLTILKMIYYCFHVNKSLNWIRNNIDISMSPLTRYTRLFKPYFDRKDYFLPVVHRKNKL
jgi:transposase-like protein